MNEPMDPHIQFNIEPEDLERLLENFDEQSPRILARLHDYADFLSPVVADMVLYGPFAPMNMMFPNLPLNSSLQDRITTRNEVLDEKYSHFTRLFQEVFATITDDGRVFNNPKKKTYDEPILWLKEMLGRDGVEDLSLEDMTRENLFNPDRGRRYNTLRAGREYYHDKNGYLICFGTKQIDSRIRKILRRFIAIPSDKKVELPEFMYDLVESPMTIWDMGYYEALQETYGVKDREEKGQKGMLDLLLEDRRGAIIVDLNDERSARRMDYLDRGGSGIRFPNFENFLPGFDNHISRSRSEKEAPGGVHFTVIPRALEPSMPIEVQYLTRRDMIIKLCGERSDERYDAGGKVKVDVNSSAA